MEVKHGYRAVLCSEIRIVVVVTAHIVNLTVSDSGVKVCDLPPMCVNISDSGAKVCDLPPLCVKVSDSGVKVCDLPPMMSGGISLCRFLLVL